MDAMYQSLGGDGYISPGRRSYHPSTDLRDNPHKHRIARYSLAALTSLVLLSSALAAYLFFPRPLSSAQPGSGSAAAPFALTADGRVTFAFNHTLVAANPNYYPLTVDSTLLTFTLPPPPPLPAPNATQPQPAQPAQCAGQALELGQWSGAAGGGVVVGAVDRREWVLSGAVVGEAGGVGSGGVLDCLVAWCWRGGGVYEVWMDALVRVSYLQMEAALVAETVTVGVECPHDWWRIHETEKQVER